MKRDLFSTVTTKSGLRLRPKPHAQTKRSKTTRKISRFCRLLRHSARKRDGLIPQLRGST